jgi:hypothetical protein
MMVDLGVLQIAPWSPLCLEVLQTSLNGELAASLACCVGASALITVLHTLRSYPQIWLPTETGRQAQERWYARVRENHCLYRKKVSVLGSPCSSMVVAYYQKAIWLDVTWHAGPSPGMSRMLCTRARRRLLLPQTSDTSVSLCVQSIQKCFAVTLMMLPQLTLQPGIWDISLPWVPWKGLFGFCSLRMPRRGTRQMRLC